MFFYSLKWLACYLEGKKHFVLAYFVEKQAGTKLPIFDRKPWTNPFGKIKIFDFFIVDIVY